MQTYQYPPTEQVTAKSLAAARTAAKREKALAAIARNTVSTEKVQASDGNTYTVTTLAPCNRGRNARGTTGAKRGWGSGNAKHAKRAKRQGSERMGNSPRIARTNPYPI